MFLTWVRTFTTTDVTCTSPLYAANILTIAILWERIWKLSSASLVTHTSPKTRMVPNRLPNSSRIKAYDPSPHSDIRFERHISTNHFTISILHSYPITHTTPYNKRQNHPLMVPRTYSVSLTHKRIIIKKDRLARYHPYQEKASYFLTFPELCTRDTKGYGEGFHIPSYTTCPPRLALLQALRIFSHKSGGRGSLCPLCTVGFPGEL